MASSDVGVVWLRLWPYAGEQRSSLTTENAGEQRSSLITENAGEQRVCKSTENAGEQFSSLALLQALLDDSASDSFFGGDDRANAWFHQIGAFDQFVDLPDLLSQGKGVVKISCCGLCFVAQGVAIDMDNLIKLRIFGDTLHEVAGLQVVHLRAAYGNDINGTCRAIHLILTAAYVSNRLWQHRRCF